MVDKDAPVKVAAQDEARDTGNRKSREKMEVSGLYKLCHPASRMGEHRVSWENMEITKNMGDMENINQMT